MTKKTAISLPDDLYREIERARKRARKDRSAWLQEAASDYLKKRTKEEEIEAYFAGYERVPLSEDELSFIDYGTKQFGRIIDELEKPSTKRPRK